MVKHHPPADFLTEYAAGVLPMAQSACVAAHLSYCQRCRHIVERLEDIGGAHFEQLDPQPVGDSMLDRVLARLDDPEPLRLPEAKRPMTDFQAYWIGSSTVIMQILRGSA